MIDTQPKPGSNEGKSQVAIWTAVVLSLLSLAILVFELFTVFLKQSGTFYPGDKVFTPFSAILVGVGLYSFFSIRRGRYELGTWLLFLMIQLPSLALVIVLRDFTAVAVIFLLVMSAFLIWYVFPTSSRRAALIVTSVTAVIMVGIELWNPAFRVRIGDAAGIVSAILLLGGLVLLAILGRQIFFGNILARLVVFISILIVVGVGVSNWLNLRSYQSSLTGQVGSNLTNRSSDISIRLASEVGQNLSALRTLALTRDIQDVATTANQKYVQLADIAVLDKQWVADDDANINDDPLVSNVLNNITAEELRRFQNQFSQQVDVFMTGVQGYNVAASNRPHTYLQSNQEWWNTAYRDGQFVGQPVFNASTKTIAIPIAVAIREYGSGKTLGVLRTTINFAFLGDTLSTSLFGTTGRTLVFLPNGKEFRLNDLGGGSFTMVQDDAPVELVAVSASDLPYQTVNVKGVPVLASFSKLKTVGMTTTDQQAVLDLNWIIVTLQDQSEALLPITTQTNNTILLSFIIIFVGIILAIVVARLISDPITRLTNVAQKVAAGDLSATAAVEGQDEVGVLAKTFNGMVTQLRDLIGTLEERVTERTKALNTSTEITRRLATILSPSQLALEVVEQVQTAFNYYHAHIYYLDEASGDLIMAGGTGEAGAAMLARGHKVPKGRGLVGRAADTNAPVLVPDVSQEPGWLPNVLLPDTKSEVAIPISSGKQVFGVLDVQQNKVNGLTEADVQLLQSLAGQVAISLQNARSFEQSRSQAELDSMANTIGQKIQRAGTIEEVLQVAIRELGLATGAARVSADIALQPDGGNTASQN